MANMRKIQIRVPEYKFKILSDMAKYCGMTKQELVEISLENQLKFLQKINGNVGDLDSSNNIKIKSYFIRLTDDEFKRLEEQRKRIRMTKQEFGRRALLDKKINVIDLDGLNELIVQINKIGVNINQITRVANENKLINKGQVEAIEKMEKEVWRMLNSFLSKVKNI